MLPARKIPNKNLQTSRNSTLKLTVRLLYWHSPSRSQAAPSGPDSTSSALPRISLRPGEGDDGEGEGGGAAGGVSSLGPAWWVLFKFSGSFHVFLIKVFCEDFPKVFKRRNFVLLSRSFCTFCSLDTFTHHKTPSFAAHPRLPVLEKLFQVERWRNLAPSMVLLQGITLPAHLKTSKTTPNAGNPTSDP